MENKIEEFLKSQHLYPERGIHNESGTLIGLGDLLNDFAQALSNESVSDEEIAKRANFNEETWETQIAFDHGAKWMRSKLSSESEWVRCEERLPEDGGRHYLAYNESKGVFRPIYNKGFKCFEHIVHTKDGWYSEEIKVTHWMQLPKSPIKEGKGKC